MLPSVNQTERDGALGVLPPSAGRLYALAGVSTEGPINSPATFARIADLIAAHDRGPLVEAAAHYIERYGRPVVVVRTEEATPGSYLDAVAAVDGDVEAFDASNVTGTSVVTVDPSTDPLGAYDIQVLFGIGGTRGTPGIVYQVSLDGGATFGLAQALGSATTIAIGATGVVLALAAGTIVAGDYVTVSTSAPVAASAGELEHSGLQNAPTLDGATHPDDDYEVRILFVAGGTRGTPGVTYRWSLDNGRTYSPITALGTATSIVLAEAGGVKIDLGAGTIAAGASIAFPCVAPKWDTTTLAPALDALRNTAAVWEIVHVVGPSNAAEAALVDTKVTGMAAVGKMRAFILSARMPVGDETEADYLASLTAEFSGFSTKFGAICAGAVQTVSSVTGRAYQYKRPLAFVAAAREASVDPQINTAAIDVGSLVPARVTDSSGNPLHHDEAVNPGLDDARFYVARTHEGYAGVFVNRPLLFSTSGSDFRLMPHRRVMNRAREISRAFMTRRLNEPLACDPNTGFLREKTAQEIEARVNALLRSGIVDTGFASSVSYVLSRTDNILSGAPIRTQHRIVPLAYPETIEEEVSFENPALRAASAAT